MCCDVVGMSRHSQLFTYAALDEKFDPQLENSQFQHPETKKYEKLKLRSHGNSRGVNSREVRGFFGHTPDGINKRKSHMHDRHGHVHIRSF